MTKVDISQIKVGDKIAVEMTVTSVDFIDNDFTVWAEAEGPDSEPTAVGLIRAEHIVSYTPKPVEFKTGDKVTWGTVAKIYEYIIEDKDIYILMDEDKCLYNLKKSFMEFPLRLVLEKQ